ncbi:hypothetical protein I6E68_12060 [Salinibacterium sp. NSLL150]|uniref:hypothetical protein n=1 Tax=unclassified Salinibacterium TaxID=2632331 RepID=UPI0018CF5812|nr:MULTISPECIES: hypothetical protein [unclassified Salinibacterium]MBH0099868.1 hypothetical protein [Salinibacterium sp. NSLL35]MBH0102622.1 hypothetical protein [Salinibacterium sp. NSLL150]MBH0105382.1 hypothetical protein [Salinibacterium sp. NSLL16]MBH0108142.1 hypothetical protein [Salinibacterium sp. NSLL17]
MRKLALILLAASAVLVLAGCTASANPEFAPASGSPAEFPEWVREDFTNEYSDLTLVSEDTEEVDQDLIYSARNTKDFVCVVIATPPTGGGDGDDWFLSAGCVPPSRFAENGAMVSYGGGGRSGGAHLFPTGFNIPLDAGWVRVSPQLAIKD